MQLPPGVVPPQLADPPGDGLPGTDLACLLDMLIHEVRNPLALIQLSARNIASGRIAPGDAQQAALARIERAVLDIAAVLDRCVETDQLERGGLQARAQPEDAAACLRDWLDLHPDAARIDASLPDRLDAAIDADLWLAMVRNLVDNALKYAPPGAQVTLRLDALDGMLRVEVANPPGSAGRPDPARLFSKYYRAAAAAAFSGTGLGLYWVAQLSARLGGALQHLPPGSDPATDADDAASPVVFRLLLPR